MFVSMIIIIVRVIRACTYNNRYLLKYIIISCCSFFLIECLYLFILKYYTQTSILTLKHKIVLENFNGFRNESWYYYSDVDFFPFFFFFVGIHRTRHVIQFVGELYKWGQSVCISAINRTDLSQGGHRGDKTNEPFYRWPYIIRLGSFGFRTTDFRFPCTNTKPRVNDT